ncbi:MAG: M48 family metallopeptidase [Gammaproteobacteria bacterium]|nr:M48 family metallopeptidase [Gammaproteobacteria bacterium]
MKSRNSQSILIQMHGIDIHLSRKPIKNINLRINAEGKVNVSAPIKCSLTAIEHFLQEKQGWIIRHREQLLLRPQMSQSRFLSGDSHLFLGQTYTLIIHENAPQQKVALEGKHVCCYLKESANQDKKRLVLKQWHQTQMKALIPELLAKWEPIIGVKVNQWGIKAMKTRWGSCNTIKKRIWLNLYLIHHPLGCLEYVLVHELVHLLEASHNYRFYALMTQFMPDWQVHNTLLKNGVKNIFL